MDRKIKACEIEYLAAHLEQFYTGPGFLSCLKKDSAADGIHIPHSSMPVDRKGRILIAGIPVLFPLSEQEQWFRMEGKNPVFHHDILKSAFYLLSGYQEQNRNHSDSHGRYAWKHSIQKELGITGIPVVNHYFNILLAALEMYCREHGLDFSYRKPAAPRLFLSHDIDRIRKYSFRNVVHTGLNIGKKAYGGRDFRERIRDFKQHLAGFLGKSKDPYRNVGEMMALEKSLGLRSSWYFLKHRGAENSKYAFTDPYIRTLLDVLPKDGHEIGLHGTLQSCSDSVLLQEEKEELEALLSGKIKGIRQHYLKYRLPESARAQEKAGFSYDSSLGFAEQVGFRNSYAHPFHPYDFEREEAMDLLEIPLLVMEASLLEYMRIPVEALTESILPILEECKRFNGVFSLLWHNCRLDEEANPGINRVYGEILELLMKKGFQAVTGKEIAEEGW